MKREILGICFDDLTRAEALSEALSLIERRIGGYIVTVNPEMQLRCQKDAAARQAVDHASLTLADGVGTLYASRILGCPLRERVTGVDLSESLLEALARKGGSVFLYGAKPGVAERAAEAMEKTYPGLRIAGTENGYISSEEALVCRLREIRPDLLLVGLGAPRQELWMEKHRVEALAALSIGVGGCLDVMAGDLRRAPLFWQRAGLEWLFRLIQEPRRFVRILPLPKVLWLAAKERFRKK